MTRVTVVVDRARFAFVAPEGEAGVEAAAAMARLFGALVLFLFPRRALRVRLSWVAAGLLGIPVARHLHWCVRRYTDHDALIFPIRRPRR